MSLTPTGVNSTMRHLTVLLTVLSTAVLLISPPSPNAAGITDITRLMPEPELAIPPVGLPFTDPAFGTSIVRLNDAKTSGFGKIVPEYSQLQAWNADMTMLLVVSNLGPLILDAGTFQILHTVDYKWPAWGAALRWSPTDPMALYYLGEDCIGSSCRADDYGQQGTGPLLRKYELTRQGNTVTAKRRLIKSFPEYAELPASENQEELSNDGRFVALLGRRPDNIKEVFAYDLQAGTKGTALALPSNAIPDWVVMSPSGKYVVVGYAGGTSRFRGVEAYDPSTMNYAGKVSLTLGHGDLVADAAGNDYLVQTNASNAYMINDKHYLIKAKIPVGVVFDSQGNVDEAATLNQGATVPLINLDWSLPLHISCQGRLVRTNLFCAVSTDPTQSGVDNGLQPFEGEIFAVYLDSRTATPHIERLAHHRSRPEPITTDGCPNAGSYWAQPHATISPDGSKILFGSNWKRVCDLTEPVDTFQLFLTGSSTDRTPPASPRNLRVQ